MASSSVSYIKEIAPTQGSIVGFTIVNVYGAFHYDSRDEVICKFGSKPAQIHFCSEYRIQVFSPVAEALQTETSLTVSLDGGLTFLAGEFVFRFVDIIQASLEKQLHSWVFHWPRQVGGTKSNPAARQLEDHFNPKQYPIDGGVRIANMVDWARDAELYFEGCESLIHLWMLEFQYDEARVQFELKKHHGRHTCSGGVQRHPGNHVGNGDYNWVDETNANRQGKPVGLPVKQIACMDSDAVVLLENGKVLVARKPHVLDPTGGKDASSNTTSNPAIGMTSRLAPKRKKRANSCVQVEFPDFEDHDEPTLFWGKLQCGSLEYTFQKRYSISMVACGDNHVCALTGYSSGGHLFAWGSNSHGQLGIGDRFEERSEPTSVQIDDSNPVTFVACGKQFTICAVLSDGEHSLYSWGKGTKAGVSKKSVMGKKAMDPNELGLPHGQKQTSLPVCVAEFVPRGMDEPGEMPQRLPVTHWDQGLSDWLVAKEMSWTSLRHTTRVAVDPNGMNSQMLLLRNLDEMLRLGIGVRVGVIYDLEYHVFRDQNRRAGGGMAFHIEDDDSCVAELRKMVHKAHKVNLHFEAELESLGAKRIAVEHRRRNLSMTLAARTNRIRSSPKSMDLNPVIASSTGAESEASSPVNRTKSNSGMLSEMRSVTPRRTTTAMYHERSMMEMDARTRSNHEARKHIKSSKSKTRMLLNSVFSGASKGTLQSRTTSTQSSEAPIFEEKLPPIVETLGDIQDEMAEVVVNAKHLQEQTLAVLANQEMVIEELHFLSTLQLDWETDEKADSPDSPVPDIDDVLAMLDGFGYSSNEAVFLHRDDGESSSVTLPLSSKGKSKRDKDYLAGDSKVQEDNLSKMLDESNRSMEAFRASSGYDADEKDEDHMQGMDELMHGLLDAEKFYNVCLQQTAKEAWEHAQREDHMLVR